MEVGVEEAVLVEHADDRLGPKIDQALSVLEGHCGHSLDVGAIAIEVLHTQHVVGRELAVDQWEDDVGHVREIVVEGLGVLRLQSHLDLAQGVLAELVNHPSRLVARDDQLKEARCGPQQGGVSVQEVTDIGFDDFEDHLLTGRQSCPVALGNRGRAERHLIHLGEYFIDRPAEIGLDDRMDLLVRHRREVRKKVPKLGSHDVRENVLAQAQDLTQFDVGGAEDFEPHPELDREGFADDVLVKESADDPGRHRTKPE